MSHRRWSRHEVCELLGIADELLGELEREGIVVGDAEGHYTRIHVERLRICLTLREELGVNLPGIEVALHLLERIQREREQFGEVLRWVRRELGAAS